MRHSKLIASSMLAFALACASNVSSTDPFADMTVRAQGTITIGASHAPNSSTITPSVTVSFVPDTSSVLSSCGQTSVDTCVVTQAPDCMSLSCGIGETCGWDGGCNAACIKPCSLTCGDNQLCKTAGDGTESCVAIQTFDAGPVAISGTNMPVSVYPPYGWKSSNAGSPFAPGADLRVQAEGPTGAGFAAFDRTFKATTLLEANPPLDQLNLDDVFGAGDLGLGWVPGNDRVFVLAEGAGGSARCLALDNTGAFTLPRSVIAQVMGSKGVQALSLSIERIRLERHQDAKTLGSLDAETVQSVAWIDLATTSTESISLQACKSGETSCGTKCVNTQGDSNNCGTCGHACGTNSACVSGSCTSTTGGSCSSCEASANSTTCSSEYASCTGTCKSLLSCAIACNGDTTCAQNCETTYSSGVSAFQNYYACLCGSACTSECATQCGQ